MIPLKQTLQIIKVCGSLQSGDFSLCQAHQDSVSKQDSKRNDNTFFSIKTIRERRDEDENREDISYISNIMFQVIIFIITIALFGC